MDQFCPHHAPAQTGRNGGPAAEAARMLAEREEQVCLEMRRHGVVLARPLIRSGGLAVAGIFLLTLPWAGAAAAGAVLIAIAATFTLRAVWQWERTRIVVTTEKLYVINGTLHRRTKAVNLRTVDAVEVDQSLIGQLLGYGTVVVGPLTMGHVAEPKQVCQLVEELAT
jgi:membrane protein YdbS with pleckstrin-like domain